MNVYFEIMRNEITVMGNFLRPPPQTSSVEWYRCYKIYMHLDYDELRVTRV